ncbi:CobW/HypB/UreG, nucleotide-binding domain-domain-containing protein [Yarrowia lipolytica]|nr:CobW/HypB/UreG, nucleotide-binding domain-domain-containing protein [Yarrowia lipolytica]
MPSIQKPIPVTLLSGFLGAGKTTLLENILKANHGYKIAVVVNDMSALNIDASLLVNHKVSQKKESMVQLQNGCICCTLRGDLLEEMAQLAFSGKFDYIVIESTGISEPMQVAETFTQEFTTAMLDAEDKVDLGMDEKVLRQIAEHGGLAKLTALDTAVTVIDSFNFLPNFETFDLLKDRWEIGMPEDERTISDLLVDQIEFSNVIILNKTDTISTKKQNKIKALVRKLNPVAKVITTNFCKVDLKEIINTGLFQFDKAATSAGWLQSIHEMTVRDVAAGSKLAPKPETEEYNINNFVYRARAPFHPLRLHELIRDKFLVMEYNTPSGADVHDGHENATQEAEDDDQQLEPVDEDGDSPMSQEEWEDEEDSDDESVELIDEKVVLENKKNSVFGNLLRSKGYFWLATRHILQGEWSQAGAILTIKPGQPWFCVMSENSWPDDETVRAYIKKDFQGIYGDRRNEIVFIGENIDTEKLTKALDHCLLTPTEMRKFERIMKRFNGDVIKTEAKLNTAWEDGFEDWPDIIAGGDDDEE